jgi:hypothetical protein
MNWLIVYFQVQSYTVKSKTEITSYVATPQIQYSMYTVNTEYRISCGQNVLPAATTARRMATGEGQDESLAASQDSAFRQTLQNSKRDNLKSCTLCILYTPNVYMYTCIHNVYSTYVCIHSKTC